MLSCTGSALVWLYCTNPKTTPMAQMSNPRYMSVAPLMPPSPLNATLLRSGILISASLADRDAGTRKVDNNKNLHDGRIILPIGLRSKCSTIVVEAKHFLPPSEPIAPERLQHVRATTSLARE